MKAFVSILCARGAAYGRHAAIAAGLVLAGCAAGEEGAPPNTPQNAPETPPVDIGPKPTLPALAPFSAPAPVVFTTDNGITVWLFERHALPLVSAYLGVPSGSAMDPKDAPGLAYMTADMLDEGAGSRDAVAVSSAIADLGAALSTGATADYSFVGVSGLKANFKPAFEIFADVVARPRFEDKEWKRVSDLWIGDLKKRSDDPGSVSRVVASSVLYGAGTPYGHPVDGTLAAAPKVTLAAVKSFYAANWRPDRALLVVAGDVTKAELTGLLSSSFASWKAPKSKPPVAIVPKLAPVAARRLVLVDRKDAPQSVIAVVRDGVSASDPRSAPLDLVNTALGGSFTSRLNQNLREDHHWTYGASSGFSETRGTGTFIAHAAVVTPKTGVALAEMLKELDKMASEGLSDEELDKVKAQDRADLVTTYETVGSVSHRLGKLGMLGLPQDHDAAASKDRQKASLGDLKALGASVNPGKAIIVIVGPVDQVKPQLADLKLGEPELYDTEGNPVVAAAPKNAKKKP
jgi:predicted Zn-dependent peptidase